MDLFEKQIIPLHLNAELGSAEIVFWPNWLTQQQADDLLDTAINQIVWRQDSIKIVGKTIPIPRLQNWFGDPATSYTYSGIRLPAVSFPDWMEKVRLSIEQVT